MKFLRNKFDATDAERTRPTPDIPLERSPTPALTRRELDDVIQRMSLNKAAGPDGIPDTSGNNKEVLCRRSRSPVSVSNCNKHHMGERGGARGFGKGQVYHDLSKGPGQRCWKLQVYRAAKPLI